MSGDRRYIQFVVVRAGMGTLEPIHPGALPFYDDAERVVNDLRRNGIKNLVILTSDVWSKFEDSNAQGNCSCGSERIMRQDDQGSYWHCPQCGDES